MKVYFCTSPRIKQKYKANIDKIYNLLTELGYKHVSNFVKDVEINKFYSESREVVKKDYQEMMKAIKEAEIVIFEASLHSLAVGYLVNAALEQGKPTIVLHIDSSPPFLFENIQNEKLIVASYNLDNVKNVLRDVLTEAEKQLELRFTLLLPPKIVSFLDDIVKKHKIHRSAFIRNLIEEAMKRKRK